MKRWHLSMSTNPTKPGTLLEQEQLPSAMDIMQCSIVTVSSNESVYKAIGMLAEKHLSGLPVVDNGKPVGIISEKDILHLLYETENLTGTVNDYMTRGMVGFDIETNLCDIGKALIENNFRRVAILHENRLMGIISRSDLIRYAAHKFMPTEDNEQNKYKTTTAEEIMKSGLLTVQRDTPLYDAAITLAVKHITGLPVVDDGMHLQGIISEKDILKRLFMPDITGLVVEDLMTENVVSFDKNDSIFDICDCLLNNVFRRVPILSEGRLAGIISRTDIMLYILKNKSKIHR